MSDKFYSYSDSDGDEINISKGPKETIITTSYAINIPQEELPKLIAVLQSHLEEPTDDKPWFIVTMASHIIGPFPSEADARQQTASTSDLVQQVTPPIPPDHKWATELARVTLSDSSPKEYKNLARAYLELSAKQ